MRTQRLAQFVVILILTHVLVPVWPKQNKPPKHAQQQWVSPLNGGIKGVGYSAAGAIYSAWASSYLFNRDEVEYGPHTQWSWSFSPILMQISSFQDIVLSSRCD
jgi:hypothetical protein